MKNIISKIKILFFLNLFFIHLFQGHDKLELNEFFFSFLNCLSYRFVLVIYNVGIYFINFRARRKLPYRANEIKKFCSFVNIGFGLIYIVCFINLQIKLNSRKLNWEKQGDT